MKKESKVMAVISVVGAVMSRATFMGINPIAMGFFGAAYMEKQGRLFTFLAVCLGLVGVLPTIEFIKYVLVMVVVMVIVGLVESKKQQIPTMVMGLIMGSVAFCMSASNTMFYETMRDKLYLSILEGIIIFACVTVFHKGIQWLIQSNGHNVVDNEEIISLAIMAGTCVYALPSHISVGISPAISVAYFFILFFGYKYGAGFGVVTGAVCGVAIGLQQNNYTMLGVLCLLGLLVGVFRELGRWFTALVYAIAVLFIGVAFHEHLYDTNGIQAMLSCVILFLLFPKKIVYRVDFEKYTAQSGGGLFAQENMQNITKSKLKEFSEAFYQLSNTFDGIAQKKVELSKKDVTGILEELSSQLCVDCPKCDLCWKNNYNETYHEFENILDVVQEKGYIRSQEMPETFAKKCISLNTLVLESSRLFEVTKLNIAWQNRLAENREAIAGQLNEVASIIDEFSNDLYHYDRTSMSMEAQIKYALKAHHILVHQAVLLERKDKKKQVYMIAKAVKGRCVTTKEVASILATVIGKGLRPLEGTKNVISKEYDTFAFIEDTTFKAVTGTARATKVNEKVSGDNFSFINLDRGEMIMSLSDGMGTGVMANEESESVIELFEQFMEAGFAEESAIRLINSILVLKSEDQSFSTIDLSVINLYSGVCEFIKIGASASFIKRDNWVETITSTTMPAGVFNQVDFDQKSKKLYDGDFVVMMSDGVLDCIDGVDKEAFVEQLLMKIDSNNPQEIANRILKEALAQNNDVPIDDMTVLVTGLWEK